MKSTNNEEFLSKAHLVNELGELGIFDQDLVEKLPDETLKNMILAIKTSSSSTLIRKIANTSQQAIIEENENKDDTALAENIELKDDKEFPPSTSNTQTVQAPPKLTNSDKKMLKMLLTAKERCSVLSIAKELDIPMTTVQRRRKKLEDQVLLSRFILRYEKFGLRKMTLLISVNKGTPTTIGQLLLQQEGIISVSRIIGANKANLRAEALFHDNVQLLRIIDNVKSLEHVEHVTWTEVIEVVKERPDAVLSML